MPEFVENRKELFLLACRCQPVHRVPVWMMRQAGRYLPEYRAIRAKHSFLGMCKTPELASEVSLQPLRALGVDAVIMFSDILIPADAMGLELAIDDSGPVLKQPLNDPSRIEKLRDFDPEVETRYVGETIRQICRTAGPDVPVIGFAGAPWTMACYMLEGRSKEGFPTAKKFLYEHPVKLHDLLERIARTTARYLAAQAAAGATFLQLFDTWAAELSLDLYEEFALPATQQLLHELHSLSVPLILYTKASNHLISALLRVGADVLSVDWRINMSDFRARAGLQIALQGNVDPAVLLSSPEVIREATNQAVAATGGVGHILNLGHGILPSTPVENARVFVQAGQKARLPHVPSVPSAV